VKHLKDKVSTFKLLPLREDASQDVLKTQRYTFDYRNVVRLTTLSCTVSVVNIPKTNHGHDWFIDLCVFFCCCLEWMFNLLFFVHLWVLDSHMAEIEEKKSDHPMSLCIYFCKGKPIPRLLSVHQGTSRFCVPIE
jgi:hypothetical protein